MTEGEQNTPKTVEINKNEYVTRYFALEAEDKKVSEFPKDVPLIVLNKKDCRKLHQAATEVSKGIYKPKRVEKLVSRLAEGGLSSKKRKNIVDELVATRKALQLERSSWQLFDESHTCPAELHKLVSYMGRLKDFPGEEKTHAKKLKKIVKRYNEKKEKIEDRFKPSKARGVRKYLRNTSNKMRGILANPKPKKVELQHDLRKEGTRIYMNLFKIDIIQNNNPYKEGVVQTQNAYLYFKRIDSDIGNLHDNVYKKQRKGKKTSMQIDKKTRKRIIKGLSRLSDDWDSELKYISKNNHKKNK